MPAGLRLADIIKSLVAPEEYYVGLASDVDLRLRGRREALSPHTSRYRQWRTLVVIEFDEKEPALKFERYLKSGSGRKFARRQFRQTVRSAKRRSTTALTPRGVEAIHTTGPCPALVIGQATLVIGDGHTPASVRA